MCTNKHNSNITISKLPYQKYIFPNVFSQSSVAFGINFSPFSFIYFNFSRTLFIHLSTYFTNTGRLTLTLTLPLAIHTSRMVIDPHTLPHTWTKAWPLCPGLMRQTGPMWVWMGLQINKLKIPQGATKLNLLQFWSQLERFYLYNRTAYILSCLDGRINGYLYIETKKSIKNQYRTFSFDWVTWILYEVPPKTFTGRLMKQTL